MPTYFSSSLLACGLLLLLMVLPGLMCWAAWWARSRQLISRTVQAFLFGSGGVTVIGGLVAMFGNASYRGSQFGPSEASFMASVTFFAWLLFAVPFGLFCAGASRLIHCLRPSVKLVGCIDHENEHPMAIKERSIDTRVNNLVLTGIVVVSLFSLAIYAMPHIVFSTKGSL